LIQFPHHISIGFCVSPLPSAAADSHRPVLVLGTGNKKKRLELEELLGPLGFELRTLADFPNSIEVVEDGTSFAENGALKASKQAKNLGHWVLGEDSGLVVHALAGAPGIFSARYAGQPCDDQANNRKLLAELAEVPLERRTAHYVCSAALSDPTGYILATSEGECHGRIRFETAGSGGFGYDPLFELPEYHRTFGELGGALKSIISHRARAMRKLIPQLAQLLASGAWH
jgi:XTP/dITP diphosphohydrolase